MGPGQSLAEMRSLNQVMEATVGAGPLRDALAGHDAAALVARFGRAPCIVGGNCQTAAIAWRLAGTGDGAITIDADRPEGLPPEGLALLPVWLTGAGAPIRQRNADWIVPLAPGGSLRCRLPPPPPLSGAAWPACVRPVLCAAGHGPLDWLPEPAAGETSDRLDFFRGTLGIGVQRQQAEDSPDEDRPDQTSRTEGSRGRCRQGRRPRRSPRAALSATATQRHDLPCCAPRGRVTDIDRQDRPA